MFQKFCQYCIYAVYVYLHDSVIFSILYLLCVSTCTFQKYFQYCVYFVYLLECFRNLFNIVFTLRVYLLACFENLYNIVFTLCIYVHVSVMFLILYLLCVSTCIFQKYFQYCIYFVYLLACF